VSIFVSFDGLSVLILRPSEVVIKTYLKFEHQGICITLKEYTKMATRPTQECPICIETFTGTTRKEIKCPYCQYGACLKCMKQNMLNQQTPNCMNCHVEFNREFIDMHMTKAFRTKELKQHRENVLLDREKSLLPATVPYAEQAKAQKKMEQDCAALMAERQKLYDEANKITQKIIERRNAYYYAERRRLGGEAGAPSTSGGPEKEKKAFIKACVVNGCRGFLSTQYKCGICDVWVCPHCHEVKEGQKDENHKCNPDLVESVKLIGKETKPCPKCAAAIFKVSGCSQIWCTECHTTFDWNTGREEVTTNIHNPHYFEWVRRNNNGEVPRNPLDVPHNHNPCGDNRLPHINNLTNLYRNNFHLGYMSAFLRCLVHIQNVELRTIRNELRVDPELDNRDLRVKYLMNEIEEDNWKKQLQKREKAKELMNAKRQVYEMIVQVGGEHLNQLAHTRQHADQIDIIIKNLSDIIDYYNEALKSVLDRFSSKAKGLMIDKRSWEFKA
jgi:hypothetical protein